MIMRMIVMGTLSCQIRFVNIRMFAYSGNTRGPYKLCPVLPAVVKCNMYVATWCREKQTSCRERAVAGDGSRD